MAKKKGITLAVLLAVAVTILGIFPLVGCTTEPDQQAVLSMKEQRFDEALTLLKEAESSGVEKPSTVPATLRYTRGKVLMRTGDYEQAMHLFQQALEQDRKMGFARGVADDLLALAEIHEQMGRSEEALDCLEQSLKI